MIHAYAGAGQVFRRMGQCGCDASLECWVEQKEPWWSKHPAELALKSALAEAPSLEQVNEWVHETRTSGQSDRHLVLHLSPGGLRYLINPASQRFPNGWDGDFSFGLRRQRVEQWLRQGRSETLIQLKDVPASELASTLIRYDTIWRTPREVPFSRDGREFVVNNPAAWMIAKLNMKTDWEAAMQMIRIGEAVTRRQLDLQGAMTTLEAVTTTHKRSAAPRKDDWTHTLKPQQVDGLGQTDPWSGAQFRLDGDGLAAGQSGELYGIPNNHPLLVSAGGPSGPGRNSRRPRWISTGAKRYYPLPARYLPQLKKKINSK